MVEKSSIDAADRVASSSLASKSISLAENHFSFPKQLRVTKSTEYKRLSQKGKRVYGNTFVADFLQSPYKPLTSKPRIGITVSKKFGKAHERNRFKRLVKEAFRLNQHVLPPTIIINIRPSNKTKGPLTVEAISHDLKRLFIAPVKISTPGELVLATG